MTTASTTPRLALVGDGSSTQFTFNFQIADSNSIAVYVGTSLKVLTSDYTITFDSGSTGTGKVVFNTAPADAAVVYLIRDTDNIRAVDFAEGGAFFAATVNAELDRLTQGLQDLENIQKNSTVRVVEPHTESATLTLPSVANRANKMFTFDGSGNISASTIAEGTVTSVGISSSNLTVSGSPVTTGGTIAVSLPTSVTVDITGDVLGNVTGNLTGNVLGNVTGNVIGNVTGDINGVVTGTAGSTITGNVTGNVTGDVLGDLTGNVAGNIISNSGNSTLNNLQVTGDLTVSGTTTTIDSTNLSIEDAFIELNRNNSSITNNQDAGIFVRNGNRLASNSDVNPALYWDHGLAEWRFIQTDVDPNTSPASLYDGTTTLGNVTLGSLSTGPITATAVSTADFTVRSNSGGDVLLINDNNISTLRSNDDINLTPAGTGIVNVSGNLTASTLTGSLTGNVSGNVTGNVSGNVTGDLDTGNITIADNNISTTQSNSDLILNPNGTGTINVSGARLTGLATTPVAGSDAISKEWFDSELSGGLSSISLSEIGGVNTSVNITDTGANGTITITADGQTKIVADATNVDINGLTYPTADGTNGQVLKTDGAGNLTFATASVSVLNADGLTIEDNDIKGTRSNEHINIIPAGTGEVHIDAHLNVGNSRFTSDATSETWSSLRTTSYMSFQSGNIVLDPASTGDIIIGSTNANEIQEVRSYSDLILSAGESSNRGGMLYLGRQSNLSGEIHLRPGLGGAVRVGSGSSAIIKSSAINQHLSLEAHSGNANVVLKPSGSGTVSASSTKITSVADPTSAQDAATKAYVDLVATAAASIGDLTFVGSTISAPSNANLTITNSGTGNIDVDSNRIINLADPVADADAVTKAYVDNATSSISTSSITEGNSSVTVSDSGTGSIVGVVDTATVYTATLASGFNAPKITTDGITIEDNDIVGSRSNENLNISASGTGSIVINKLNINNAYGFPVSDGTDGQVLQTDGVGNLTFATVGGGGGSTGDLAIAGTTISTATNADLYLTTDGTGEIQIGHIQNDTSWPTTYSSNGNRADGRWKGNQRFYSDLAVAPITTSGGRIYPHSDITVIKLNGSEVNNSNHRVRPSKLTYYDINGSNHVNQSTNTSVGPTGLDSQVYLYNTAGGTVNAGSVRPIQAYGEIMDGHTGDMTTNFFTGVESSGRVNATSSETSTLTNYRGIASKSMSIGGNGTPGTNQIITNHTGFYTEGFQNGGTTGNGYRPENVYSFFSTDRLARAVPGALEKFSEYGSTSTHSSSGTYTVDANNNLHIVTLGANITSFTMSNFIADAKYSHGVTLYLVQDGTGGRTVSFTAGASETFKFANGGTISTVTAANDIQVVYIFSKYNGTSLTYYWTLGPAYS